MGATPDLHHIGVAVDDLDGLDRDLEQIGDHLRKARLVPLPARLRADHHIDAPFRQDREPRLLVGGPDRGLDVIGKAAPEQLAALARLPPAPLEALPIGDLHRPVHVLGVAAAVIEHADPVAVRHGGRLDQVAAPQLDAVDAELDRGRIDQPLDRIGHLRTARAAIGLGRHRVGVDRHRPQRDGRNIVGARDQAGALAERRERDGAGPHIADIGGPHGEETAIPA